MVRPGERVGDWIIEGPLGEGGMGAVYRVHSALTPRLVAAMKVMKPTAEADGRARFVREAEALAALRHPAVVRVMGFSEDPTRGLLYLVMELAVGETLRARLSRGPMGLAEALATFVPLAQGLEHAHAAGVFHRDLKPSNVVLCLDGTPRLVDFGIAASLHSEPLTTTGQLGTLPYLPPEVFRGQRAEPAAVDVYGFGLMLYEALTGEHPFHVDRGLTPAAAAAVIGVRKLQAGPLEPPEPLPGRLRELVRQATGPDPEGRPTMRDLRERLESVVERRGSAEAAASRLVPLVPVVGTVDDATTRVPDPTPSDERAMTSDATPSGARGRGRRRSDRLRAPLLIAAALGLVLLIAFLVLVARRPGADQVAASAASPGPRAMPAATATPAPSPVTPAPSAPAPSSPFGAGEASPPAAAEREGPAGADDVGRLPQVSPAPRDAPAGAPAEGPVAWPAPIADPEAGAPPMPGTPRVAGRWELTHEVQSTRHAPYAGLKLGYRLNLFQDGVRVSGRGFKYSEDGVLLLPSQRTPIEVVGRFEGDQLVLDVVEGGQGRTSRGTIRWRPGPDDSTMEGSFTSDAGQSAGASLARRLR